MKIRFVFLSLIFPAMTWAGDFEAPGIRRAVERQLAPYGLPGWHALSPARSNVEPDREQIERQETGEIMRARTEDVNRLLDTIVIPSVELQDVPL